MVSLKPRLFDVNEVQSKERPAWRDFEENEGPEQRARFLTGFTASLDIIRKIESRYTQRQRKYLQKRLMEPDYIPTMTNLQGEKRKHAIKIFRRKRGSPVEDIKVFSLSMLHPMANSQNDAKTS